jgi:outer membrane receptor protein involved in Fe transport
MRLSVSMIAAVGLATASCDQPLTGPTAQQAYSDATQTLQVVPEGRIIYVDGKRLATGERLDQIDPQDIVRIEIVKGEAAARLFGDEAKGGVVQIFTKVAQAAQPAR